MMFNTKTNSGFISIILSVMGSIAIVAVMAGVVFLHFESKSLNNKKGNTLNQAPETSANSTISAPEPTQTRDSASSDENTSGVANPSTSPTPISTAPSDDDSSEEDD